MGTSVGRSVCQHEHRPLPLPAVDAVIAVELANGDVVPAATAEDRSGGLENLVSDGAALYVDVARLLPTVAPLGNHPVHRIVRPSDEAVQRHRHVPNHVTHSVVFLCVPIPPWTPSIAANRAGGATMPAGCRTPKRHLVWRAALIVHPGSVP